MFLQGSWGGAGTKKAAPKPYLIKKVAGVDPTTRADHKKAHVIISEKRDKKAAKYQVKDLPFPYTSKAQFERSMDTPIGAEWNTRVGFQRGTLPKVVKKVRTLTWVCAGNVLMVIVAGCCHCTTGKTVVISPSFHAVIYFSFHLRFTIYLPSHGPLTTSYLRSMQIILPSMLHCPRYGTTTVHKLPENKIQRQRP